MSKVGEKVYTWFDHVIMHPLDHVRMHPNMYYKKIGDGTEYGDCIYLMLQEIIDNSVDEFKMGYGNRVEVSVDYATGEMSVRDYGRGAFIEKLDDCFIFSGFCEGMGGGDIKMDDLASWCGAKAVSALSESFQVRSVREGKYGKLVIRHGKQVSYDIGECSADEKKGLLVRWTPDAMVLPAFTVVEEHVVRRIKECVAANPGLTFFLNGREIAVTA